MVRRIINLGVTLFLLTACDPVSTGGDDGVVIDGGGGGIDVVDPPAADAGADASTVACASAPACGAPTLVSSKADLREIVDACESWSQAEVDRYRARTRTLKTSAPLYLCPEDFVLPAICAEKDLGCFERVLIEVDPRLDADATVACNGISIDTGVSFRLRLYIHPPQLGFPDPSARLTFEPPCTRECSASERRCDANSACYDGDEVCFQCGHGDRAQCACRTPDLNSLPPCSECDIFYGDFIDIGNCHNDTCVTSPEADPELCTACPEIDQCVPQ
jgi:hypothetical protein